MTYIITNQCIECHRCVSACPTRAITQNEQQYQINPERCNDCVGHYTVPQCWAVCPTNSGCIPREILARSLATTSPNDYWDTWFGIYNNLVSRLKANCQPAYWHHWFDTYSQALAKQLQTPRSVGVNA
ncbi:4Fe-4S ferredoxin [filamentous cyanobacterium CCP1]|nr:4Fe-4S ferredoxin [filamentous cyanobacterium CCP2]PSB67263.1 4Fe-4S ferredoxin [filamentous cyanobacterium CCP1]